MKARLSNGQVVELEKGCNCTHHVEPHWLYMNTVWKNKLSKRLDTVSISTDNSEDYDWAIEALEQIRQEQIARLHELLFYFDYFNIDELLEDY